MENEGHLRSLPGWGSWVLQSRLGILGAAVPSESTGSGVGGERLQFRDGGLLGGQRGPRFWRTLQAERAQVPSAGKPLPPTPTGQKLSHRGGGPNSAPGKIQTAGRQEKLFQACPHPWHSLESGCPLRPLVLSGWLRSGRGQSCCPASHPQLGEQGRVQGAPGATISCCQRAALCLSCHPPREIQAASSVEKPFAGRMPIAWARARSQLSLARGAAVSHATRGSVGLIPTPAGGGTHFPQSCTKAASRGS